MNWVGKSSDFTTLLFADAAISKAIVDQTARVPTLITSHFSKFIHCLHSRTFPIAVALSSIPAPRRGNARHSRPVSTAPLSPTFPEGDVGPGLVLAPIVHSSALSATDTTLAASASLRRSSRINFGVPKRPSSDSHDFADGVAVDGRGRL